MRDLTTRVQDSLGDLDDAALDHLTGTASVFFDRRWLRMLEMLPLSDVVGGKVALRYVVASRGGQPVGLCPFLVTRSRSIYSFYSLEKFFFSSLRRHLL